MTQKKIELVPYDPKWAEIFAIEAKRIRAALGDTCVAVHHFGSTSIPGLHAKSKIDILAVVKHFEDIHIPALERLGFENRGETIPTGRYFARRQPPRLHVHVFEEGNPIIEKNLRFCDWLRAHEDDRNAYEKLKLELALEHTDGMSYCRAKTDFIEQILRKASTHQ